MRGKLNLPDQNLAFLSTRVVHVGRESDTRIQTRKRVVRMLSPQGSPTVNPGCLLLQSLLDLPLRRADGRSDREWEGPTAKPC